MATYSFNYSLSDRRTLLPLFLSVEAPSYRVATRRARRKLDAIVKRERAAYWEWVGKWGTENPVARYIPYHFLRGYLYHGALLHLPRASYTPLTRENLDALVTLLCMPIIDTIAAAPVMADIFATPLSETTHSIPLEWVTRMPRDEWPHA